MKRQYAGFANRIKLWLFLVAVLPVVGGAMAQGMTNLFFLHHSTGGGLIEEGNMRAVIAAYNTQHNTAFEFWDHGYNWEGLRNPAGEFTGTSYEIPNDNTDPDGLYYLWVSAEADAVAARNAILGNHQVIAFKSCFPASAITDAAMLNQYKTWYLGMRDVFDQRTDRLFIVMSTPPLHRLATDATQAANARAFANWLKSEEYLGGHSNVVCFDLFGYLAGADNFLRYEYEASHDNDNSHPNTLANQTVGPIFAQFMMTSAAAYATTTVTNPPSAPAGVKASDGIFRGKVRVAWSASSGASSYEVWRNTTSSTGSAARVATSTALYHDDTNAAPEAVYYYWVKAKNSFGTSGFSAADSGYACAAKPGSVLNDYSGDGRSDLAVFNASSGTWHIAWYDGTVIESSFAWGWPGAWPVSGDYDGDGRSDCAVFDQNTGWWFVMTLDGRLLAWAYAWGWPGAWPVPGDYDGDGRSDCAVFDQNTGWWFVIPLNGTTPLAWAFAWGWPGAWPVSGDYDGDGVSDCAVFDQNTGWWFVIPLNSAMPLAWAFAWGWPGAWPVPGDYDGDGRSDCAVFDQNTGWWFVISLNGTTPLGWAYAWGWPGAWPVPGDYDGDGRSDCAVFDQNTGLWFVTKLNGAEPLAWAFAWGWTGAWPVGWR